MSDDYTKLKANEIRQILMDEHGYSKEEMDEIKGKTALVTLLKRAKGELDIVEQVDLDNIEEDAKNGEWTPPTKEDIPDISSPQWHNYVMSLFESDEVFNGNPTVDGMRRVLEYTGQIINSITTNVVSSPDLNNNERATVMVTVTLGNGEKACGAADAYNGNTTAPYNKHLVSFAETRAEGRALKRLLRLRKVIAAEELVGEEEDKNLPANDTQFNFINRMCHKDRLNMNVIKFVEKEGFNIKNLKYNEALKLAEILSNYQSNIESIPDEIKGYISNWR